VEISEVGKKIETGSSHTRMDTMNSGGKPELSVLMRAKLR
jgi:hypothetical protein